MFSQSCNSVSDAIKQFTAIKRAFKSRYNKFHFITAINIDITKVPNMSEYLDYMLEKIKQVNYYIDANKVPPKNNQYVKDNCFFCLYKSICQKEP